MKKLTLDYITAACNGKKIGKGNPFIEYIATDSREEMNENTIFVALQGEKYDGHQFVEEALKKGAAGAIISKHSLLNLCPDKDKVLILVDDTLLALQSIARKYRQEFNIPVVAVTGSVGKTTTREILAQCLNSSFNILCTARNYNNDIGLPLTIMRMEEHHEAAVVEVAMRGKGEISRLVDIARPTCAIITNIEPVHLETLGSVENIAQAKCEVLENLSAGDFAFINGDNELLIQTARNYPCHKYTFGYNEACDCRIIEVKTDENGMNIMAVFFQEQVILNFPLPTPRLAANVAAAVGAAMMLGVTVKDITDSLAHFQPADNRLKITKLPEGGLIIDDTYNANPLSMQAALETGCKLKNGKKFIAVLGDMFELGHYEIEGHVEVGKAAFNNKVDILVAVGKRAEYIAKGALQAGMDEEKVLYFINKAESLPYLQHNLNKTEVILFKASRGMQLETLIKDGLEK